MEFKLTEHGKELCKTFITELKAKRKEILDAGIDTADETELPTENDILSDLNYGVGTDEYGDYYNGWSVTDHYNSDHMLWLEHGKHFVEI